MVVLGIVLVVVGWLVGLGILTTLGVILIAVGVILALVGTAHPIAGRRHYW